ncbi:DUF2852 domain-containing protein [Lichenihabitans psoromatis]|uniref:DUF2852 domain-containing protein n=1 Tax=Lichenihabitans psoromatis TaxID=2528642 RepID=UPI001035F7C3|nr:DUF2852 domain-containing protein [Lichenihabitans psoromatis]
MSSFSSTADAAGAAGLGGQQNGSQRGWGGCGSARMGWKPVEIGAVVLGFLFYWPVGVALIGLKIAQRRGYTVDQAVSAFRGKMSGFGMSGFGTAGAQAQWRPFSSSGNAAFDDWRNAELQRLEEERRKLDTAQREFAEHLNNLRRAKDREEFDRFMNARNQQGSTSI